MFTWPTLSAAEVGSLYMGGAYRAYNRNSKPRADAQSAYVKRLLDWPKRAAPHVVELGCTHGHLISSFASPNAQLSCFEPTPSMQPTARTTLSHAGARSWRVLNTTWNAAAAQALGPYPILWSDAGCFHLFSQ